MYLVGCDPELFLKDSNDIITSAHGLVKGTKDEPFPVNNGAVQVDGLALEFNTTPVDNADAFVNNVFSVMEQLEAMVTGYKFHIEPVAEFGWEYLEDQPMEALELGCDPDYNAYGNGLARNPRPDGDEFSFRTAAGHVHVGIDGWDTGSIEDAKDIIKMMDCYLGVPSVLFDRDTVRREMYGRAGAYRIKPYGVEYRVLSNFWIKDKALTRWVFNNTMAALNQYNAHNYIFEGNEARIATIINDSDVDMAKEFIKEFEINVEIS